MGTSHRHKAGPIGSPNWGKSSAAVSSIANTEKADVQLQQDPSIAIPQEAVDRKRVVYAKRINTQYHNAVRYLVRAAGGRASVSSGRSRAVGRAGVVWATGLAHAFHEIAEQGLVTWLNRKGYNFYYSLCSFFGSIFNIFISSSQLQKNFINYIYIMLDIFFIIYFLKYNRSI